MNPDTRHPSVSAGTIIGWCVLAAGIGQVPIIVAGLRTASILPQLGLLLLIFDLPSGLLLFLGGLGLIYRNLPAIIACTWPHSLCHFAFCNVGFDKFEQISRFLEFSTFDHFSFLLSSLKPAFSIRSGTGTARGRSA